MNDPTTPSDQTSLLMDSVEAEIANLAKQRSNTALEGNAKRIRSSLVRLSSSSIDDLEALTAELKRMQDFLNEPPRVFRRPFRLSHAARAGCSSMA